MPLTEDLMQLWNVGTEWHAIYCDVAGKVAFVAFADKVDSTARYRPFPPAQPSAKSARNTGWLRSSRLKSGSETNKGRDMKTFS